ncbi:MAG TPA: hypothetical protein DCS63_08705 [Elusimicrobia bacterium]|nr:hypothetical protein [Elusimicrobiota bacterium]
MKKNIPALAAAKRKILFYAAALSFFSSLGTVPRAAAHGLAEAEEMLWGLGTEVVTPSKRQQTISDAPSTIHVITQEDIRNSGANNIADVLRMVPGIEVKTWLSEFSNVAIRGMLGATVINERILWIVDGVPLNDVRDCGVWIDATFPMDMIKRIEVMVGPGSTLYGTTALLGVIQIITKAPEDLPERGEYNFSYGSFNTQKYSATYGKKYANSGFLINANTNRTDGSGLVTKKLSPGQPAHSGRDWSFIRTKYEYKDFVFSGGYKDVRQDYSGAYFAPYDLYTWRRGEQWGDITYKTAVSEVLSVTGIASLHRYTEHFYDFADVPGLEYDIDSHRWHMDFQTEYSGLTDNTLVSGVQLRSESYDGNDFYANYNGVSYRELRRDNWGVYLQNEHRFFDEDLIATTGVRLDSHPYRTHAAYDNVDTEWSPRITFIYKFLDKKARIKTTYGKAFKEPANWQRFIDQPSGMGTPNMAPERASTYEASLGYDPTAHISLGLDLFKMRVTNIIWENFDPAVADPAYLAYGISGKFHPQQTGRNAEIQGLEFYAKSNITHFLGGYFNYSYLEARDSDNVALDYDARHKFNLGLTAKYGKKATLSLGTHYVGRTTDRTLEAVPGIGIRNVKAYMLTEAKLRLNIFKESTLALSGWNLGGKVHEQQLDCPVPGPTYALELSCPF